MNPEPLISRVAAGLLFFCFSVAQCVAQLSPSPLFGDHAVLQRERPVAVWGWANPGSKVVVTFGKRSVEVPVDEGGRWMARLPELSGGESGDLIFESGNERVVSRDVVVGDVWLCTGQSNMEWTVKKSAEAESETAAAHYPTIRHFKVLPGTSDTPRAEVKGRWVVCSPETVGDFTAIGYFLAKDLLKETKQPQGLINSSWGGTAIETWLSTEAVDSDPTLAVLRERWEKAVTNYPAAKERFEKALVDWEAGKKAAEQEGRVFKDAKPKAPDGGPNARGLSRAYNAMIHPLAPYTIRGDIWYQGEANWKYPTEYGKLLESHIRDIRSKWNDEDLPFIVVQLPGYGGDGNQCWPYIREGQADAVARLPGTGLVVTADLGEPKEIHPTNKQVFGQRVARVLRRVALGEDIEDSGPLLISADREGVGMRVKLDRGKGVVLRDSGTDLGAFELAGDDRVFHPASAVLESGDILVTSPAVTQPVALRYAWREFPRPIIFNTGGLPAAPFRSDDWPPSKP